MGTRLALGAKGLVWSVHGLLRGANRLVLDADGLVLGCQ